MIKLRCMCNQRFQRLSDMTLHFKTTEALAREMTERAKVPLGRTPFLYQEIAV